MKLNRIWRLTAEYERIVEILEQMEKDILEPVDHVPKRTMAGRRWQHSGWTVHVGS
jgi:hypothetical protein